MNSYGKSEILEQVELNSIVVTHFWVPHNKWKKYKKIHIKKYIRKE